MKSVNKQLTFQISLEWLSILLFDKEPHKTDLKHHLVFTYSIFSSKEVCTMITKKNSAL